MNLINLKTGIIVKCNPIKLMFLTDHKGKFKKVINAREVIS